jgi:basic membrane protein A
MVTDVGTVDDKSFNQSAYEGLMQAKNDLEVYTQYIETTDLKDYAKNIATFANAKYKVIITVGFNLTNDTITAAKKYPDIKFIGIDQSQTEVIPNLTGLIFPEDVAGFLVGTLAAQMTKSLKIGAVCGADTFPPVWQYCEGYRAGAAYINPKVEVTVVYHNDVGMDKTFTDPEWGKTTALSMIDKGVDIVFGVGGKTGNGALDGAAQMGVYAIGVDADQYYSVPEAKSVMPTSATKLITPGTFNLVKLAINGQFPGGNYEGTVEIAPYQDLDNKVPDAVKTKMIDIQKQLMDGTLKTNVASAKPAQ